MDTCNCEEYNNEQYELINKVVPMLKQGVVYPVNEKCYSFNLDDILDVKRDIIRYSEEYRDLKYYEKNEK